MGSLVHWLISALIYWFIVHWRWVSLAFNPIPVGRDSYLDTPIVDFGKSTYSNLQPLSFYPTYAVFAGYKHAAPLGLWARVERRSLFPTNYPFVPSPLPLVDRRPVGIAARG